VPRLHVNVDHVATVRQARRSPRPDPVAWAVAAERAGADGITCHLRKDRRHVVDADLPRLRAAVTTLFNLESSLDPEMLAIALASGADEVCLVPENRAEITTEGGLDVVRERQRLAAALPPFRAKRIRVSLFVDPDRAPNEAAAALEADFVELHTGAWANAGAGTRARELERLAEAARLARSLGLHVNAGHGLLCSPV
jgi:pyridoxine 5-phosphate synthase